MATDTREERSIPGFLGRHWLLLAVVIAAAVPRIWLAMHQHIEYDGWWHVFIARESAWRNFWRDVRYNAHPPLFFLLLKFACLFGKSRLIYRSVSLIAGLLAVHLMGSIGKRITDSRLLGALCAATFGFSVSAIIVSNEVRSYMLAVAFMLAAIPPFLEIVALKPGRWSFVLIATALTLAITSHYSAVFFLFATVGTPIIIALFNRGYRGRLTQFVANHAARLAIAWGIPLLATAFAYRIHIRMWNAAMNYMPQFYFHRGEETVALYLERSIFATYNLFSPIAAQHAAGTIAILIPATLLMAVVLTAWFPPTREIRTAIPVVLLALMAGQIALAGLFDRYPFGGHLRHQFVLFPFIILSLFALAGIAISRFRARSAAALVSIVIAAAIAANAWSSWRAFHIAPDELRTREVAEFRRTVPSPENVYLDQFNSIFFFSHYHDWDWRFSGYGPENDRAERYTVTRKGRSIRVVRAAHRWNLDPLDPGVYESLRRSIDLLPGDSISLFCIKQGGTSKSLPDGSDDAILALAAERGLNTDALLLDGMNVFGSFSTR